MDFAFGPYFEKQYLVSFLNSSYLLCELFSLREMRSSRFKSFLVYINHTKKNIPKNIKNIEKSSQPKLAPSLQGCTISFRLKLIIKTITK